MFNEHLDLLRSGVGPSDPRRVEMERQMRLALDGPPVAVLSDEAKRRAIEWFGEAEDSERAGETQNAPAEAEARR